MPRVIDGKNMAAQMLDSLSGQIGGAIVTEIFPVSVVALNGDQVVLSQGGESLQVGQRWHAVALGEELKDPQTGRSLGRNEMPAGIVRIDRVSGKTSYGTFEDGGPKLSQPFKSGGIELRKQALAKPEQVEKVEPAGATTQTAKPAARAPKAEAPVQPAQPKPKDAEDKNW